MIVYQLVHEHPETGNVITLLVLADSTEVARQRAAKRAGPEGADAWLHIGRSTCLPLPLEGEPRVLLRQTDLRR